MFCSSQSVSQPHISKQFLSLTVLLAMTVPAFAESDEPMKITTIEGISEHELSNGMKVLLFPDASKPSITVNLTLFVGSRHEGYGEAGMAHLLEHMLFKGTPTHPEVPKLLRERGARMNGTTWLDRTNYYETLPASDDNLDFVLRLEADRMMNSRIAAEDLESEMTVVRNEFERGENSPSRVLFQRMVSAAYDWHNYGRSTIGNRADIERVPIEKLQDFYRRHYQPDNAMLVVAGRFDEKAALGMIQKHFGAIPRPDRELDRTYTEEPAQDGERSVILRRVGDVGIAGVVYHIPAGAHPDYVAVDVLESVLTTSPGGRLYEALVRTGKAASVGGGAFALHDPGFLMLTAEVARDNEPQSVLESMLDAIADVRSDGVSEEELERAKQKLLRQRELAAAESDRIAVQLSEWAAQGDWRLYFLYRDRLEQVTAEDIQRVAALYLDRNNRTVGMYIPTGESERIRIPVAPLLAEMIGDYKGREDIEAGEAFDVSPENIESRTTRSSLPGGIRVAVLPKRTRGRSVNLRLTLRYGNLDALTGHAKAAELLAPMMLRGTKNLTRQQIRDELDRLRSQLSASGGPGTATFTIRSQRDRLLDVLNILRQVLREPVFPEEELEIIRTAATASLEKQLTDPTSLATTSVNQDINPYQKDDPRYVASPAEDIERVNRVTVDEIRALHDGLLSGTNGELTVVGDFDPDEVLEIAGAMFDSWESDVPWERISQIGDIDIEPNLTEILTPDKANATYFAATVFPMRDDHPDYPTLVIGNAVLGGSSLTSRLGDRVRQEEGLSYSVGSGLRASALDERTSFYIYAITNPVNMTKLREVIREEVDRMYTEGITEEELQRQVQGHLQQQRVTRTDDAQLTSILERTLVAERTMEFTARREEAIRRLTTDEVVAALQRWVSFDRMRIAAAGDFQAATDADETAQ